MASRKGQAILALGGVCTGSGIELRPRSQENAEEEQTNRLWANEAEVVHRGLCLTGASRRTRCVGALRRLRPRSRMMRGAERPASIVYVSTIGAKPLR